jgi:hypothetical protein
MTTLSSLDHYPGRFFSILETIGKTIRSIENYITADRLPEQEVYLSQAVDYSDFEYRMKRLRYSGKF